MTRKPVEELVVGAARGEPMDVDERERLTAALAGSPELRAASRAQAALTADLAALRAALGAQTAPAGVEEERLREAFRAARGRRAQRRRQARPWALAASGVAVAATLVMVVTLDRPGSGVASRFNAPAPGAETAALAPGNTADAAGGSPSAGAQDASEPAVFYALPYGPGLLLGGSYSIVRVRIPLAAFAAGSAGGVEASVEADLLVGDDGIPSAIRFADGGTLLVSTNSQ